MKRIKGFCLALIIGGIPVTARATNGLNLIGFGAESVGMGGADLAVARDPAALNTNPAGLTQIEAPRFDISPFLAFAISQRHRDVFGNDTATNNTPVPGISTAYARPVSGTPLTVGIGLFAQGGAGVDFDNVRTAFGTVDEMLIKFGIARLTPGFAWQVNDSLSAGASLIAAGATLEQELFPGTSIAPFFGFRVKHMLAVGLGAKVGLQYKFNDRVTLGMSYTTKTRLDFDDGEFRSNQSAVGFGKVTYRDAEIDGLATPQEFGIGVALRPVDRLLMSFEANWLDWSEAVKTATLSAGSPDRPALVSNVQFTSAHNWRDQYVLAAGLAYEWNDDLLLRAGYNYGRNPIPRRHLTPFFPTVAEHHVTTGFSYRLAPRWAVESALEFQLNNRVSYTNPDFPFGQNAEEEYEVFLLHIMLSRRW